MTETEKIGIEQEVQKPKPEIITETTYRDQEPETSFAVLEQSEQLLGQELDNVGGEIIQLEDLQTQTQTELDAARQVVESTETTAPQSLESTSRQLSNLKNQESQLRANQQVVVEIKSYIPESARNNVIEIAKIGRERFTEHLGEMNETTLIEYMKAGGMDPLKSKRAPRGWRLQEWQKRISGVQENQKPTWMINPKFCFLSKSRAAEIAFDELVSRLAA